MKSTKFLLFAFVAAAITLSGCKKEEVRVQSVALDKTALELTVPTITSLTATVAPADAANRAVEWKSDKPDVATVDATGKVTAVAAGIATITVTTEDGGKTATCTVTVTGVLTATDDAKYDIPAMTVGTAIEPIDLSGAVGGGKASFTFTAEGLPAGIAISAAGVISGTPTAEAKAGTATVTVTDGSTPPQTATLTISTGASVTVLAISNADIAIGDMTVGTPIEPLDVAAVVSGGTEPYAFAAEGLPEGLAIDPATGIISGTPTATTPAGTITVTVTDSSTLPQTATVDIAFGGAFTYSIGASSLTSFGSVETGYSQPTAQTVTITNTGTGAVTLTQPTATYYDLGTLSATELAAGATATFTVRPKSGLSAGSYNETITITGSNGTKATVAARFAVTEPAFVAVTGISGVPVAARNMRMTTLTGTVAPAGATNKTITWSIKDDGGTGAEMVYAGQFVPLRVGTIIVTATIANGATATTPYTQDFVITVATPEITITEQPADITVKAADKLTVKAKLINGLLGGGRDAILHMVRQGRYHLPRVAGQRIRHPHRP